MNNITYISYYTKGYYKKVMEKYLLPSLLKWNLFFCIKELPNKKQWKANTEMKAQFILNIMNWHNTDVVWIDADAVIKEYPMLLLVLSLYSNYDVAVHTLNWQDQYGKNGKELLSGTLYFRNNKQTKDLLKLWIKYADKFGWEQRGLEQAIKETPNVNVFSLPRSYCYIGTKPDGKPPKIVIENPVIEHFQVSREVKKHPDLLQNP
jgi:hypothetical protein